MPTFGDTTAGADTFPCSNDRLLVSRFELTEAGDVTSITMRFDASSTAGANFKGIIYSDGSGVPNARQAVGSAVAVPAGGGLVTSTLTVSLSAGFYWIGIVTDSFQCVAQCDASGVDGSRWEGSYASPGATWTETAPITAQLNVYATYTAAGGGGGVRGVSTLALMGVQ